MRRIIIIASTAVLAILGWFTAAAYAAPASSSHPVTALPHPHAPGLRSSQFEWCEDSAGLCMHDPNGGGIDTVVVTAADNGKDSFDWALNSNGTCGGTVTSTCPGGWLSSNESGDAIVTLKNIGGSNTNNTDLCIGFSNSTGWAGKMKTCNGFNGNRDGATLLIYDTDQTDCTGSGAIFYSYNWQVVGGGTNGIMSGSGVSGGGVVIGTGVQNPCQLSLWNAFGS